MFGVDGLVLNRIDERSVIFVLNHHFLDVILLGPIAFLDFIDFPLYLLVLELEPIAFFLVLDQLTGDLGQLLHEFAAWDDWYLTLSCLASSNCRLMD